MTSKGDEVATSIALWMALQATFDFGESAKSHTVNPRGMTASGKPTFLALSKAVAQRVTA